jgi:hypothetical protein
MTKAKKAFPDPKNDTSRAKSPSQNDLLGNLSNSEREIKSKNKAGKLLLALIGKGGQEQYDPHRIPPRIEWAKRHGEANLVGIPNSKTSTSNYNQVNDMCPCCGKSQSITKLSMAASTDKLYFLGIGVPLFFHYACFCLVSMILATFTYGIYMVIFNLGGEECVSNKFVVDDGESYCGDSWKINHTLGNRLIVVYETEKFFIALTFVLLLILRIFWFRQARKKAVDLDSEITTPKDYTLMITGLPRDVTEKEVRNTFENYTLGQRGLSAKNSRVYRVNFAYYIGDFIKIARQKNESLKVMFKEKRRPWQDEILIAEEEAKVKEYDSQL